MMRQYIIRPLTGDYLTIFTVFWMLRVSLASGSNWVPLIDV